MYYSAESSSDVQTFAHLWLRFDPQDHEMGIIGALLTRWARPHLVRGLFHVVHLEYDAKDRNGGAQAL
jgi:hypothetical protein